MALSVISACASLLSLKRKKKPPAQMPPLQHGERRTIRVFREKETIEMIHERPCLAHCAHNEKQEE